MYKYAEKNTVFNSIQRLYRQNIVDNISA